MSKQLLNFLDKETADYFQSTLGEALNQRNMIFGSTTKKIT